MTNMVAWLATLATVAIVASCEVALASRPSTRAWTPGSALIPLPAQD
jgi:hypothetical protein